MHLLNTDLKKVTTDRTLILQYIFLINLHYFVEMCFHFDINKVFFVNFVS